MRNGGRRCPQWRFGEALRSKKRAEDSPFHLVSTSGLTGKYQKIDMSSFNTICKKKTPASPSGCRGESESPRPDLAPCQNHIPLPRLSDNGIGSGHGLRIQHPASRILYENRWKAKLLGIFY